MFLIIVNYIQYILKLQYNKKDIKMKQIKLLIASAMIIGSSGVLMAQGTNQMVKKDNNQTEKLKETKIAKGTTIGHYQKPGAPVDLSYQSTKVAIGEVADVNISITTAVHSGDMEVNLDFDKSLEQVGDKYDSVTFSLAPNQKEYNINLKVKGEKDGLYYIRLLVKVNSKGSTKMRALAVPVYVGDGELKKKSNQLIMKAMSGENISVSKAEETIEIIK